MYTRKQFAEIVGVAKSELYYYEKRGLLLPDTVSQKGFRYYSDDSILLYKQIQQLQYIGYSLDEIQSHLNGTDGLTEQEFYDNHEKALKEKLQVLKEMRSRELIRKSDSKKLYVRPVAKKERN